MGQHAAEKFAYLAATPFFKSDLHRGTFKFNFLVNLTAQTIAVLVTSYHKKIPMMHAGHLVEHQSK